MLGFLLLIGFLVCGVVIANGIFRNRSGLIRLWLGLCTGLMLMMWLPAIFAFIFNFTRTANLLGLALAALLACSVGFLTPKERRNGCGFLGGMPLWMPLMLILPLLALSGYLQYTHYIREAANGALHVGQSTYGDLCLHLGIATGTVNAAFPPDYTILPGTLLGYPFLSDTMVSSMLLFGSGLAASFVVTGTLMMGLVYTGFVIFAWEITKKPAAVVLAFVLMFINGGLGFLYHLDGVFKDPTMFKNIFTGFYQTPTNMPELNLRWVNVICDMMIPQRTLLGGWTVLLPALYMLADAIREQKRSRFVLLGVWAGLMPMVHTHSFFALGLASIGVMFYQIFYAEDKKESLIRYLCYGVVAMAVALPQLLTWTFPQTIGGGSLAIRFNWVNNQGNGQLIDGYFWFWIKNVGLVYLFMLPAALACKKGSLGRTLSVGALVIYVVAEFIQFQPNPYDNNKLFYVAYMLMLPLAASWLTQLWEHLKGLRGRTLLAAAFIFASTVSGSLSIAREVVSDYQLFNANEVAAAEFIKQNSVKDDVFLTGQQHCNAVAALTGRYIVCGTGSYLYYHGVDYSAQSMAIREMLERPAESGELFEQYDVDYVYLSSWERSEYAVDEGWFMDNMELVYSNDSVRIYSVE